MIFERVNGDSFARAFKESAARNNFERKTLYDLFDYLENLSEDMDSDIELDPIAIASDYSEVRSIEEYNENYGTEFQSVEEFIDSDEGSDYFVFEAGSEGFVYRVH